MVNLEEDPMTTRTKKAVKSHHPDKPFDFSPEDYDSTFSRVKYRQVKTPDGKPVGRQQKWKYGQWAYENSEGKPWNTDWPHILLEDAVGPKLWKVELDMYEIVEVPREGWSPKIEECDEYEQFVQKEFEKAQKKSDSVEGLAKGKMFSVGVADGSAYYVITGVAKGGVKIEWRGFCPDRWTDRTFGYGGKFPKHCITPHVGGWKWGKMASR